MRILDNTANNSPGVYLMNNCTLLNNDSLYSGNKARNYAGVIEGVKNTSITNINTMVINNVGIRGIVSVLEDSKLLNKDSTFR